MPHSALSIAGVVAVVGAARLVVPFGALRLAGALALLAVGAWRLRGRRTHPRWVGMRVGFRDLTLWSFLMASAHGAGLMLVPVVIEMPAGASGSEGGALHAAHHELGVSPDGAAVASVTALTALGVHMAALLLVMTVVAVLVFEVLGVRLLRRAWINLDLVWSAALIIAGVVTLLLE
jgi:hypothetical protein